MIEKKRRRKEILHIPKLEIKTKQRDKRNPLLTQSVHFHNAYY